MAAEPVGLGLPFSASTDVNGFYISEFRGGDIDNNPTTAFKIKTVPQKAFLFNVTGSISGLNLSGSGVGPISASVQLMNGSTVLGSDIFITSPVNAIEGGSGQFGFSVTSSLGFNDSVYLRIRPIMSVGARSNPSAFTASIHSFAITSTPTGSVKELVVEPYLTSPFYGTDCDVLYGNASKPVSNQFLQDIDYDEGQIIPVNNIAIISGTADKGTVPESYYTALAQINPRYNGSKNQSLNFNIYQPLGVGGQTTTDFGDPINIGTYGQTPSIDVKQSLVAYCDWIGGTTPELNDKVAAHVKYLINENGDAISPNLSEITINDVHHNFTDGQNIEVSLIDPAAGSGMQVLNGLKGIIKGGYRVEPILYSQIPTSPFSSSITMETSSLIPIEDIRNSAIRNTDQTAIAGISNTLVCTTELFDRKNSYDNTTGAYTVQSATVDSGVDLVFKTILNMLPSSSSGGLIDVRIENTTTGELIVQDDRTTGGGTSILSFNLSATVQSNKLVAGHVYKVLVDLSNFGNDNVTIFSGASFETSQIPSATTDSFLDITGSFWGYSASRLDVITGSQDALNNNYNFLKQEPIANSGFNNTQFLFTIEPGDQFRFQDDESKVYNVIRVVPPDQEPEGKIKVFLDRNISTAINKDYFVIRRYVEDGSYIIFDETKPAGDSGAAFIKPQFASEALNKDVDQFIQDLKSKNLLT